MCVLSVVFSTAAVAVHLKERHLQEQPWSDAKGNTHTKKVHHATPITYLILQQVYMSEINFLNLLFSIRTKENENDILTACEKELLTIAEYNEVVENQEEGISSEQQ